MKLKKGTVVVEADCVSVPESACFLCTGPAPRAAGDAGRQDCEQAYMVGLLDGVRAMTGSGRMPLCPRHEVALRELLVTHVQDVSVFRRLGILAKVVTRDMTVSPIDPRSKL